MSNKDLSKYWGNGLKKTKQREAVLSVLLEENRPLTAMEIYTYAEKYGCQIWLSTVYRILDLFNAKGIITKNILADSEMSSYEMKTDEHRHYAICIGCHKMIPMDNCPIKPTVNLDSFHITGHKLEIYGYCDSCYCAV